MRTRARLALALTAAATALTLTGCTADAGPAPHDPTPAVSVSDVTTDTRQGGGIVWKKWGEPVTVDGVTLTLGAPEGFTASSNAHPDAMVGKRATRLVLRVENGRPAILKSYEVSVAASLMSGVVEAMSDPAAGVGFTGYAADLLPGRSQEVPVGFAVAPDTPGFAVTGEVGIAEGPTVVWSATGTW